jgi:hypothetical protein
MPIFKFLQTTRSTSMKSILFLNLTFLSILTTIGNAQTSGPTQPEVQSFQAASITNMVETSTGEFQYNIPLFKIGGYPVTINYNSQVGMENEASMVGLGFNLNCGVITRQVRGLPDDFNGDKVNKKMSMKPNITTGIDLGTALELVGFDLATAKQLEEQVGVSFSSSAGIFFNNYSGWGIENKIGVGFHGNGSGLSGNAGIGINSNSQHGTSINPYFGISYETNKKAKWEKGEGKRDLKKVETKEKKLKTTTGLGFGFNSPAYTPKLDFPFRTSSIDMTFKLGYAWAFVQAGGEIHTYRTKQVLRDNDLDFPAFGFLYAEKGKLEKDALMDFNRDHDGVVTEDTPNLPFTYATPDVYSVAGHGIGGVFELHRNNVFVAFDATAKTRSHAAGTELDLGFGVGAHVGGMINYTFAENTSGKWSSSSTHFGPSTNEFLDKIDFSSIFGTSSNNSVAEQVYFKSPTDVMFNNNPIYDRSQTRPIAPELYKVASVGGGTKRSRYSAGSYITDEFVNKNRDNRLDVISYLKASEAKSFGFQRTIENYTLNNFTSSPSQLDRVDNIIRKDDHLSEMTTLKADGTKYVFNIPAYNNEKKEVSYSLKESDIDPIKLETNTLPDLLNLTNHIGGNDDYISLTTTPAFAHSFLLGSVLSPNYIDVDDNGPSINDIGDYVKFNYARLYDSYYWRSNNSTSIAQADLGSIGNNNDAKASFTEGTKEIWYLHSIETKNEISRFYYSDRNDAYDLKNSSRKLKKLDSIYLYTRPELLQTNPIAQKRIYFDFTTSSALCKGINNNPSQGKLTLGGLYFKNGASNKGKHSAYKFEYSSINPNYNYLEIDRWGNYKPNVNELAALGNKKFPFLDQRNKINADNYASAWLVNTIKLPEGGEIKIDYEAHDYAYVQNKRAMYMAKIVGVSNGIPSSVGGSKLYNGSTSNNYLIFKLKSNLSGTLSASDANQEIRGKYFTDPLDYTYGKIIKNPSGHANLYGKFRINLPVGFDHEDVPVFLDAEDCGAFKSGSGDYDYGYVLLEDANIGTGGGNANQISKYAWQFVKHNYSSILFGMDADPSLSVAEGADALLSMFNPVVNITKSILNTGPYIQLRNKKVADEINLNASYIRLYEPSGYKFGGNGARVKKVTINDNWLAMVGSPATNTSYSIEYKYTKNDGNKEISSGVASYEPENGGEENPWKQPIFFKQKNGLMPDDNNFIMKPYGESLFPSANIVYSEVRTIQNSTSGTPFVGTGYSKNKYYTYFDFPCTVYETDIDLIRDPKVKLNLFKFISMDFMVTSQGYSVVTNDMHGKPKSEELFGEKNNLISGKYYKYKTNNSGALQNKVKAIDLNGNITDEILGVETQVYGDARRFFTETYDGSFHFNIDLHVAPPPVLSPSKYPQFSSEMKTYTSFTLSKHVREQGVLDSVIVLDKGAKTFMKNELWDAKTGAVLMTQSNNEFDDALYNFTYPAHWAYSGMGMASDNIGAKCNTSASSLASSVDLKLKAKLQVGDILAISNGSIAYKYVVEATTSPSLRPLYKSTPAPLTGNVESKIIWSGKRNLPTTPIGSFTSLINPIASGSLVVNAATKIINSSATEYGNISISRCDKCDSLRVANPTIAPNGISLLNSTKNIAPWQALASYKFVGDRNQASVRNHGWIDRYTSFWNRPSTGWIGNPGANWQFTEKIYIINPNMNPVESKNPLDIYSSSQQSNFYGMLNAVTNNARYNENLFDGFEDIKPLCETQHYSILDNNAMLDNTNAHTGYYSMKTNNDPFEKRFKFSVIDGPTPLMKDCSPRMTLFPNKEYILSAWVREANATNNTLNFSLADIKVNIGSVSITCKPTGNIIDGWQRIETKFTSPAGFNDLVLTFSKNTNFDDVRIFPFNSNMKSYVYSYKDYSLMAILDENNFATFYEYDGEKQLKRTKKETEKGVMTIQEVNFGSFKK